MDRAWIREYWPFLVGAGIIVVGNVYFYGLGSAEWSPVGVPFVVALLVVLLLEIGRELRGRAT
jgi:hypothetical protein